MAQINEWLTEKTDKFFFQNEKIFVQLDELDELDRITMHE